MLITPKINPYNYTFPSIVEDIKLAPKDKSFIKFIKHFGFKIQKVHTIHPAYPNRILRVFYLNVKYNLVAKFSNRHVEVPKFNNIMPSFCFPFNERTLTLQPLGHSGSKEMRANLANTFCVDLARFDCVPDNFVIFRGLPALIDW